MVVPPAFRREIYRELGSLYSNEAAEEAGLRWAQHYEFCHQMAQQLGGPTEVRVEVNKSSPVVWLKTRVVSQYLGTRAANRNSSGRFLPAVPLYVGDYAIGDRRAWLFIRIQNRPLVDPNMQPCRWVKGLFRRRCVNMALLEVRSATRAFNHMAAGVKQLADDRTLLMAG